jgi:hypothetical protein
VRVWRGQTLQAHCRKEVKTSTPNEERKMDYREEQEKADREAEKIAHDLQTLGLLRKALNTHATVRGFIVDRASHIKMEREREEMGLYPDLCSSCAKIESLLIELLEEDN